MLLNLITLFSFLHVYLSQVQVLNKEGVLLGTNDNYTSEVENLFVSTVYTINTDININTPYIYDFDQEEKNIYRYSLQTKYKNTSFSKPPCVLLPVEKQVNHIKSFETEDYKNFKSFVLSKDGQVYALDSTKNLITFDIMSSIQNNPKSSQLETFLMHDNYLIYTYSQFAEKLGNNSFQQALIASDDLYSEILFITEIGVLSISNEKITTLHIFNFTSQVIQAVLKKNKLFILFDSKLMMITFLKGAGLDVVEIESIENFDQLSVASDDKYTSFSYYEKDSKNEFLYISLFNKGIYLLNVNSKEFVSVLPIPEIEKLVFDKNVLITYQKTLNSSDYAYVIKEYWNKCDFPCFQFSREIFFNVPINNIIFNLGQIYFISNNVHFIYTHSVNTTFEPLSENLLKSYVDKALQEIIFLNQTIQEYSFMLGCNSDSINLYSTKIIQAQMYCLLLSSEYPDLNYPYEEDFVANITGNDCLSFQNKFSSACHKSIEFHVQFTDSFENSFKDARSIFAFPILASILINSILICIFMICLLKQIYKIVKFYISNPGSAKLNIQNDQSPKSKKTKTRIAHVEAKEEVYGQDVNLNDIYDNL